MLNEQPTIQLNSFDSFKHNPESPGYWGDVYGLPQKHNLTPEETDNVIELGFAQIDFNPEYTYTTDWKPGSYSKLSIYNAANKRWEDSYGLTKGKFRCDTFVNYCYNFGLGVQIPTSGIILPKNTYKSFISTRGMPTLLNDNKNNYTFSQQPVFIPTPPIDQQQYLIKLLASETLDLETIDQIMNTYLVVQSRPRLDKLNFLWKQANHYQQNTDKFAYILDFLVQLRPIEIAHYIIDFYQRETQSNNRIKLLSTLTYTISHQPDGKADKELLQKNLGNLIKIQNFFTSLLVEVNDTQTLMQAKWGISAILPPIEAQRLIENALKRIAINKENSQVETQFYLIRLGLAFSNAEMQQLSLPQLLKEIQGKSAQSKMVFNKALFTLTNFLKPADIIQQVRETLLNYLETQKSVIKDQVLRDNIHIINRHINPFYEWLKLYCKAKSNSPEQMIKILSNYVEQLPERKLTHSISLAHKRFLASKNTVSDVYETIDTSQTSSASSIRTRGIISSAFQYTNELITIIGNFLTAQAISLVSPSDNSQALIIHPAYSYETDKPLEGLFDEPVEQENFASHTVQIRQPIVASYVQQASAHLALWWVGYEIYKDILYWCSGESRRENLARQQVELAAQQHFDELKQACQHLPYAAIYFKVVKSPEVMTVQEIAAGLALLTSHEIKQLAKLSQIEQHVLNQALANYPENLSEQISWLADDAYHYAKNNNLIGNLKESIDNCYSANSKISFWTSSNYLLTTQIVDKLPAAQQNQVDSYDILQLTP
jgi:hypothetical protein